MMMKNLIKTLGFILALAGPSVVMATTSQPSNPDIIRNRVCIESDQVPGEHCDYADVTLTDDSYACLSISGSRTTVPNSGGNITFTCKASDNTKPHTFEIDCGNGVVKQGNGTSFFRTGCYYGNPDRQYYVACYVDGQQFTNPACKTTIGYGFPDSQCGDGILSGDEECDLWNWGQDPSNPVNIVNYLDNQHHYPAGIYKGLSCKDCKIISGGNFVYEPAECLYSDSPISVMNDEYLPYWWNLWIKKDTQSLTDDDDACTQDYNDEHPDRTLLLKDSMDCYFAVYNGKHNQNGQPLITFKEKCYNNNFKNANYKIFDYFKKTHHEQASGANFREVNKIPHTSEDFGEYKLVLEKVEYKVCNNGTWTPGEKYGAICEVNFAVTKPYIMQISTFGVNPVGSNGVEFLGDYYNMYGNGILTNTDLNSVIETDNTSYAVDYRVDDKFNEFKEKYEKLAVKINVDSTMKKGNSVKSVWEIFGKNDGIESIKKVPNKSIYFIKGKPGTKKTLVLTQDNVNLLPTAYTIIVEDMDVEIVGNILQYAMVVTNYQMSFKDAGGDTYLKTSCANGGQVVQGIYVAQGGFKAGNRLINDDVEEYWCPWGGLHVKGVLIGSDIDKLMESKRSQLNSWFNASSANESVVRKARRETIIKGASVLIEYSPSLWKTLPPGAEIFTESLEVYRK